MVNHFGTQTADERQTSSQQRLQQTIEELGSATTAELVEATGLHENTVRGHLEKLLASGRVRRRQIPSTGRGRPAWRWSAVNDLGQSPYVGLAITLADTLAQASPNASRLARKAGQAWGAELAAARPELEDVRPLVNEVMREQGFAPDDEGGVITLHRCPLLAAASGYQDVVCATHAGMVEGIARTRDPGVEVSLEPFVTPHTCLLRLRQTS